MIKTTAHYWKVCKKVLGKLEYTIGEKDPTYLDKDPTYFQTKKI
jgi:hypothetical protein